MENLVFIRKIDSMGRIVIPRDLRKKVNIQNDDSLEITYEEDHLLIYKHLYKDSLLKTSNFVSYTRDLIDGEIFIEPINYLLKLPNKIEFILKDRKDYYSVSKEKMVLENKFLEGFFAIVPLINNSEVISYMIIKKDTPISDVDKLYVNVIKRFVENDYHL